MSNRPLKTYHELVEDQRSYFRSGAPVKLAHRREQLLTLKKMISEENGLLTQAVQKDLRRTTEATYMLELGYPLMQIDYFVDNLASWSAPQATQRTFLTIVDSPVIVKDPLGVVLIIAPWNYPLELVFVPLLAAMAAGNTIMIKPSERAPNTAAALKDAFSRYFDSHYLAVVLGGIPETTELLKERFDHIFYTGNPAVGEVILEAAAKHLTPATLELGGKCPVIVESDAEMSVTARRIAWGKWQNCGQTCLAPDYIIVNAATKAVLVREIIQSLKEFYGLDIHKSSDYSRIIDRNNFDRIDDLLSKSKGTILFQGGEVNRDDLFIPPVVIDVCTDDILMQDEIFGPILPIVTVSGFDEAIAYVKEKEKPLSMYLFTRSKKKVQRLCAETSSGGVVINDVFLNYLVDSLPFGGVGQSGMGRYNGKFGFDTFTHEKSVLNRGFFLDSFFNMRYPPLTTDKVNRMKAFMSRRIAISNELAKVVTHVSCIAVGMVAGALLQYYCMG